MDEQRLKQSDEILPRHRTPPRSHSRSPGRRRSPHRSGSSSPRDRERSSSPRRGDGRVGAQNSGNTLYVAGLSPRATDTDLRKRFSKYGQVVDCRLVTDPRTRDSRGFGFVKMQLVEEADAAIQALNQTQIEGRLLTVEKAKRGKPRTPTPGRYLGNDRYRGRGGSRGGGGGYHRDERRSSYTAPGGTTGPAGGPPSAPEDYYNNYYSRRYPDYPPNYYASRYDPYGVAPHNARSRSPGYYYPSSPGGRARGSYYKGSPSRYYRGSRSPSPRTIPYYSRSHSRSPPRTYYRSRGAVEQPALP